MTITEKDYRLTLNDNNNTWDLELLYHVKPKGKAERDEFRSAGYGISMEHAMKKIINYKIAKAYPDTLAYRQYLNEYKHLTDQLYKALNNENKES